MSNKVWRIIAFSLIIVPVIVRVIIALTVIYFPVSALSITLVSDFLPVIIKIQWIALIIAILISIFKIKKDKYNNQEN